MPNQQMPVQKNLAGMKGMPMEEMSKMTVGEMMTKMVQEGMGEKEMMNHMRQMMNHTVEKMGNAYDQLKEPVQKPDKPMQM